MSKRIKPHKVRGRELEEVREKDPDGRIVVHHRTVDTLGKMLRSGTIDEAMHDAAKDFQAAFIIANLDPLRALAHPASAGHREGAGAQRTSTRCPATRAQGVGGLRRSVQPGGQLRLARRRAAAHCARVGAPPRLGWPAIGSQGGQGHPHGGAGGAGGALRLR